jgi:hypothetical protein
MEIIQLILAHLIGDFFLQSDSWVKNKEQKKWASPVLYAHVMIHFLLIVLLFGSLSVWLPALLIAVSHLLIDGMKVSLQKKENRSLWFGIDQVLHLVVIGVIWTVFWGGSVFPGFPDEFLILLTGVLFLTMPASIIMQKVMSRWGDEIDQEQDGSLPGAGKYIGMLERLFVYIAILTGALQVIGFLLAAKSVFRFGDLTRSKDRKLTEYILVGTLLSFLLAIVTGLLTVRAFS